MKMMIVYYILNPLDIQLQARDDKNSCVPLSSQYSVIVENDNQTLSTGCFVQAKLQQW